MSDAWALTYAVSHPYVCAGCGVKYLTGPVWCDRPECPREGRSGVTDDGHSRRLLDSDSTVGVPLREEQT